MTVRVADDYAVIAARLRELEAERVAGLSRPAEDVEKPRDVASFG